MNRLTGVLAIGIMLWAGSPVDAGAAAPEAEKVPRLALDGGKAESAQAPSDAISQADPGKGEGLSALQKAARAERYLLVFFHGDENDQTALMRSKFRAAAMASAGKADSVETDIGDPLEKEFVDKFRVAKAPMPLALVIAPNGALTGGFPAKFETDQILNSFASRTEERCLKSLQDGKIVLVCARNTSTTLNAEARKGVDEFKNDPRFSRFTEVIEVNPASPEEAQFMKNLGVDGKTDTAVTICLAPPHALVGRFAGATKKDALIAALQKASSGGCGPSGCAPGACPPAQ